MDDLEAAIATVRRLQACLEQEIERSRARGRLIRALDSNALFESAHQREEFNRRLALLDGELKKTLGAAASKLRLPGDNLTELCQDAGEPGRRLAAALGGLRALVSVLRESDDRNRTLTLRALKWVRGCMSVLAPGTVGYDRTGSRPQHGPVSTSVRVA